MSEHEHIWICEDSAGIKQISARPLHADDVEYILASEHAALKRWQNRAIDSLLFWLEGKDDIDFTIHADRLLRELCNCENELPPCRMCERLALLEASHE